MATTFLPVKIALRDKIVALGLTDVRVTWGFPTREPGRRWVFLGRAKWTKSEWITNRSKEEDYTIKVVLSVTLTAGTPEEVEKILLDLSLLIENALKADPTLGVPRVISTSLVPKEILSFPSDSAYEGQFECDFRVLARI